MIKYLIKVHYNDENLFYTGEHYEISGSFSRDIYSATQYRNANDAFRMRDALMSRFPITVILITPVKVIIQEVSSK